jgi:quinol monooxygenase YgiN
MKNLVIVSFPAKEGMLENLKMSMKEALPDTRNFDGCISVDTYIEESTNTIHLIEDWESLEHQSKYLNWTLSWMVVRKALKLYYADRNIQISKFLFIKILWTKSGKILKKRLT